jgi:hypothetical protein
MAQLSCVLNNLLHNLYECSISTFMILCVHKSAQPLKQNMTAIYNDGPPVRSAQCSCLESPGTGVVDDSILPGWSKYLMRT